MARYLKENTATLVTVGPFLDVTDGITPEIALTATNEHITFIVDDAGTPTLVIDIVATVAGANDLVHITSDAAGYYSLELTAAQTNYTGRAMLNINYVTDHLPVWHEFQIVSANVYDALFTDGDVLDVSVTEINGSPTAAQNLQKTTDAISRGTVSTGSSQTSVTTSAFSPTGSVLDQFKGRVMTFDDDTTTATLRGAATDITGSTNAATPTFTVSTLPATPQNTDTFSVT